MNESDVVSALRGAVAPEALQLADPSVLATLARRRQSRRRRLGVAGVAAAVLLGAGAVGVVDAQWRAGGPDDIGPAAPPPATAVPPIRVIGGRPPLPCDAAPRPCGPVTYADGRRAAALTDFSLQAGRLVVQWLGGCDDAAMPPYTALRESPEAVTVLVVPAPPEPPTCLQGGPIREVVIPLATPLGQRQVLDAGFQPAHVLPGIRN